MYKLLVILFIIRLYARFNEVLKTLQFRDANLTRTEGNILTGIF